MKIIEHKYDYLYVLFFLKDNWIIFYFMSYLRPST